MNSRKIEIQIIYILHITKSLIYLPAMEDILTFWFAKENDHMHFSPTTADDELIRQKFSHLLNIDQSILIKQKCPKEYLAYIILNDQFSRHIFRNNKDNIQKYDTIALQYAMESLELKFDLELEPQERCFMLMPLRHTFKKEYLDIVLEKIRNYRETNDDPIYQRFFKATLYAYSAIRAALVEPAIPNPELTDEDVFSVLDEISIRNLTHIMDIDTKNIFYTSFQKSFEKLSNVKRIVISLSGGVDSMVSSLVMYHLSKVLNFELIAVTLKHNNRETCQLESELVTRWCNLLGIKCYLRNVDEIHRCKTHDRELYEDVTRRFRFDMYRRFECPIVLGHNQDDCLENIFSNIKKGRSYDNLFGMSEISTEDNVMIVRPMLDIAKSDIVAFALTYQVPYLYDSTPKWSERGKMRDDLIPFLKMFDANIVPGLIKLATNVTGMYEIYNSKIMKNFYDNQIIKISDESIEIKLMDGDTTMGYQFWNDIIVRMSHDNHKPIPSNRSRIELVDRLTKNKYGKIHLHKYVECTFSKDKIVILFLGE